MHNHATRKLEAGWLGYGWRFDQGPFQGLCAILGDDEPTQTPQETNDGYRAELWRTLGDNTRAH
ncbi:MAG: hypothetical protein AAGE52_39590 [Myxococcota bacterium]